MDISLISFAKGYQINTKLGINATFWRTIVLRSLINIEIPISHVPKASILYM